MLNRSTLKNEESEFVIRFLTYYDRGTSFPPTFLILGFGYMEDGLSHKLLHEIYGKEVEEKAGQVLYAGYLKVRGDSVRLYQAGGSETLMIDQNEELDRELREFFQKTEFVRLYITSIFPLIVGRLVRHCMFRI